MRERASYKSNQTRTSIGQGTVLALSVAHAFQAMVESAAGLARQEVMDLHPARKRCCGHESPE